MSEEAQSKFQRLTRMLQLLQSQRGQTTAELAEECGVDQRTVQRDLVELRGYHYPIEELTGTEKSPRYRLENLRLAGSLLNLEETLALSLCVPLGASSGMSTVARQAWDKLSYAVVNGQERNLKQELPGLLSSRLGWSGSASTMQALGMALVERRRLRLLYQGLQDEQALWRTVDPWQMFFQGNWYLRGLDVAKQAPRTFRPDRIQQIEVLTETFEPPSLVDPHFHRWDLEGDEPVKVVLELPPSLVRWIEENPVHPSQKLEEDRLELQVRDTQALLRWTGSLSSCRILEPEELRQRFCQRLRDLLDLNQ